MSDAPPGVPDVASWTDAQLTASWKACGDLTEAALEAVRAEGLKRGLRLSGLGAAPLPDAPPVVAPLRVPPPSGPVLDVRGGGAVLLQSSPGRFVLVVLPRWDPAPSVPPPGVELDAIVICNHEPRGWLDGSRWASTANVGLDHVYATARGPIDRSPSGQGGSAKLFPSELVIGNLTLRRMGVLNEVLRATWHGAAATAAIGPTLPGALVGARPESRVYVGSLPEPEGHPAWSALLMAAHAGALMSLTGQGSGTGPSVILVGDAVGAPMRWHTQVLPGLGVSMSGIECPVAPSAVALLGDALCERWEQLSLTNAPGPELEEVMEHLLIEARLDAAWRLIAGLFPRRAAEPTLQRLRGTLHALDGQHDEALGLLTQADAEPFSRVIASAVHVARRDWVAAEREARSALEKFGGDPHALGALVRCLWLSGRLEAARKVIDEAPAFSLTGTQAADLYAMIERSPPGEAPRAPALPHLAARAVTTARRSPDAARAQRLYRRALELDPDCAAAADALTSS